MAMRLSRAAFARHCASLPGVTLHEQWEALVAKVGGKVFALHGNASGGVVFKVSELAFEGLSSLEGVGQAAYFAKRQWVDVSRGAALADTDVRRYIAESHHIVTGKLTRKARAELGLG
jgi:predicted DNA-binding protein (MmcQ/YjbR family)